MSKFVGVVLSSAALIVVLAVREADSLTCACSNCGGVDFCVGTSSSSGDSCYSIVQRNTSDPNKTITTRGCYSPSSSESLCGQKSQLRAVECCKTHYCNKDLNPQLSVKPGTPMILPSPSNSTDTSGPTNIICHESNSKKPLKDKPFCHTFTGTCYKMQRFARNGSVIFERQGCLDSCVNEKRNRLHRHCCNTTFCNEIKNPLPRPSKVVQTSTSITTPHSSSSLSSHKLSSSSSISSSSTSTILTSSPLVTTCSSPVVAAGSQNYMKDSNFVTHLILSAVYVVVIVFIFFLVGLVCYKQKQLNDLRNSINVNKHESSQKSLDTIASGNGSSV